MTKTDAIEGMSTPSCRKPSKVLRQIGELDSVVCEHGVDAIRNGSDECSRKAAAACISAFSTSSTTANFEVRSMATKR